MRSETTISVFHVFPAVQTSKPFEKTFVKMFHKTCPKQLTWSVNSLAVTGNFFLLQSEAPLPNIEPDPKIYFFFFTYLHVLYLHLLLLLLYN